jgi:hypothetical protein
MPNRAFDGAERKGREARDRGEPVSKNPYGDERTHYGGVTFARGFWRAWKRGWVERDAELTVS